MKMIVEKMKRDGWSITLTVLFVPNWFEKFLGIKKKCKKFFNGGAKYLIGGFVWLNYPDMTNFGNCEKFDAYVRRENLGLNDK